MKNPNSNESVIILLRKRTEVFFRLDNRQEELLSFDYIVSFPNWVESRDPGVLF